MWGIRGSTRGKEAMMEPVVSEVFSLARVKKALMRTGSSQSLLQITYESIGAGNATSIN